MGLLHTIVGIIGNVISFGLFLSPVPTFYRIYKKKAVEGFQPYPYLGTVMNCILWMYYGLPLVKKDNLLVTTINSVGLVIELAYLTIYCIYAHDRKKRLVVAGTLVVEAVAMAIIVAVTMLKVPFEQRPLPVGIVCDIFNIIMYGSPLMVWHQVYKTKSVEYMPFWLSVAGLTNGFCWTAYALIQFDIYILISNGLGAFLGVIQLAIYGFYYFKYGVNKEVEKKFGLGFMIRLICRLAMD